MRNIQEENSKVMKVKVFEQCDPLESGSVYGVCDWCEDYDWWCESGARPLDYEGTHCESDTIKEMNVGDVFYSKAEFAVPLYKLGDFALPFEFVKMSKSFVSEDKDNLFEFYCNNNRPKNKGKRVYGICMWNDIRLLKRTVYMRHTVCEDCVKTEYMWEKE